MKVSERIAEHLKTRGAKVTALEELAEKAEKENRVFNADEQTAFDETKKEIEEIDGHVERLRETEAIVARAAKPVSPAGPRIEIPSPGKGIRFARMCQAIASSKGNLGMALELARMQWPDDKPMHEVLRAQAVGITRVASPIGTTTDPAWAGALVHAEQLSSELIELVRADAVIGRLTGIRRVPFNVRIPREVTAIGTAAWVGQGLSKPVGSGAYDFVNIPYTKVALIVVITEELARFSNPAAEGLMRDGLVRAISGFLDTHFITGGAAVANVSPGGIANGLPVGQQVASSGNDQVNIQADIIAAVGKLNAVTAPRSPVWLMHPQNLVAIQGAINGLGMPAFPTAANNVIAGYPVVTSATVPLASIFLMDQDALLLAMDDGITVDVSREASVQMDTAPATPPTPLVSFWQQNLLGLKAEMFAYWMRARDTAIVQITGVDYSSGPTLPAALAAPLAATTSAKGSPKQAA